jgi:hypothetical protein
VNAAALPLLLLTGFASAAGPQAPLIPDGQAPPYRVSVKVDLVVLHATVRDRKSGFASDLHEADFAVYEDGVRQPIGLFRREDIPVTSLAGNPPAAATDELIGRIEIPRLGLSAIVMEGTDKITLRRTVGHMAATALPGRAGNVGIAGHRDAFFRPLRNIHGNDTITLTRRCDGVGSQRQ